MKARVRTRVLLISIGVLLAFLGFQYWTTTAHYAVYELKQALKERDPATFYARVDVDRLINAFIDAIATRERLHATGDQWVDLKERVNAEIAKMLKDDVKDQIKRDIETLFNAGTLEPLSPERLGRLLPIRNFVRRVDGWDFGKLSAAGTSAHLNLILHVGFLDRAYPLVLRLQKDERWRVTGLEGLATILDIFEKDAQAFVQQKNADTVRAFEKTIKVQPQDIRKDERWLVKRSLHLAVQVKNAGSSPLTDLTGTLVLRDGERDVLRYPLHVDGPLAPDVEKTYGMDVPIGFFDSAAQDAFAADHLQMRFILERARLEDGRAWALLENWEQWPLDAR